MQAEDAKSEFEAFFKEHREFVLRITFAITGDAESASDAAQDAFVKVLDRWKRVRTMEAQDAFLKRVAARSAIDVLRARSRFQPEREGIAADGSKAIAVRCALSHLRPDQRALLALSVGEGWSYAEIAMALNIPMGTVASRIHAAKDAFRREWGEEE